MATRFISFSPGDEELPWTHWNQDVLGDWRANFYNTNEPYLRHRRSVTDCGPNVRERLEKMKAEVDAKAAADGLVTFDKLPKEIQEYWAESDANWLLHDILSHLAGEDD